MLTISRIQMTDGRMKIFQLSAMSKPAPGVVVSDVAGADYSSVLVRLDDQGVCKVDDRLNI